MQIRVGDKYEDWDRARLAEERDCFSRGRRHYDMDDGWLSNWAQNETEHKLNLIAQILDEPMLTVDDEPCHCGERLRGIQTQYGTLMVCAKRCGFKASAGVVSNWKRGAGRRDLKAEGLTMQSFTYRKAIDMSPANYSYCICRETDEPVGLTAGQMLG